MGENPGRPQPLLVPFNKNGSLLIWAAIVLIIISAIASSAIWLIGTTSKSARIARTSSSLDAAAKAVVSWSAQNNRLPDNTTFASVVPDSKDAWGNDFIYLYDTDMTAASTGGLCGRTITTIQDNGVYVAFLILSKGADFTLNSTAPASSGPHAATNLSNDLRTTDMYKVVTLEELKNKAGCYGGQTGRLTILNSYLPDACAGSGSYLATIYAAGGVSPYTYTLSGTPPAWMTINSATGVLSIVGTITNTVGTYPVTVQVSDNQTTTVNTVSKTFNLKVKSCGAAPRGAQISFLNDMGNFANTGSPANSVQVDTVNKTLTLGNGAANSSACSWYPTVQTLTGKTMRAYYNFKFAHDDTSGDSTTYGHGFTFALMDSSYLTTVCGGTGSEIGFGSGTIGTNSLALEFDIYPDAIKPDPTSNQNHIAVAKGASNSHSAPNPTCPGSAPSSIPSDGCYYKSNVKWFEDAMTHKARIEANTGYTDANCTATGSGNYVLLKAWVDCNECNDLTSDYAQTSLLKYCFDMSALNLSTLKFGFTQGTASVIDNITISNFGIGFYTKTTGPVGGWNTTTAIDNGTPQARYAHTSVANSGYLYVIGGDNGIAIKDTVYYAKSNDNGTIGTWSTTQSVDVSGGKPRYAHTSVVNNGYLYVIGGDDGTGALSTVYYASINADGTIGAWAVNTALPAVRRYHTSVVNNGYLYVIGGDNGSAQNTVYYAPFQ